MKTHVLSLFMLAALAATLVASCAPPAEKKKEQPAVEEPAAAPESPKIVAVKAEHDFGKVKQGAEVAHIFKIKNEGKGVLKIEKARGS